MNKVPMTVLGAAMLRDELHRLKSVERPKIVIAIAEARAHGDLKENAEYHAAREEQSFMEGRIQDLEAKLSHSHIVDLTGMENHGRVVFGAMVRLCHVETNVEVTYQIVGEDEADIKKNKINQTDIFSYKNSIPCEIVSVFENHLRVNMDIVSFFVTFIFLTT